LLFKEVKNPWENCMRFRFQKVCQNRGPNVPPCKEDILEDFAVTVIDSLDKAELEYWLTYGTLLDIVRNQTIPWTGDVNFMLKEQYFNRLIDEFQKNKFIKDSGFMVFVDPFYSGIIRLCITDKSEKYKKWEKFDVEASSYSFLYPFVDFYLAISNQEYIIAKNGPPCSFYESTIFPLRKIQFYDRMAWVPNNSVKYLAQIYGPDYMQPPKSKVSHGIFSKECKVEWQI